MGSPKAPTPPDPQETAQAQTGSNVATALANQILGHTNQVTPYGSQTTTQTGNTPWQDPYGKTWNLPQFTQTQTLSPDQQKLHGTNVGTQQNLANYANQQTGQLGGAMQPNAPNLNTIGGGPGMQTIAGGRNLTKQRIGDAGDITKTYGDSGGIEARNRVEDALMQRLNPQLERDKSAMETMAANKGIKIGSAAYDRMQGDYGQQANDARYGAIMNAGQEQTRMEDIARNRAGFENQAQGQQFSQNYTDAQFRNANRQQEYQNAVGAAGFNNAANQQGYQNRVGANQFNNSARQQDFQNRMGLQNNQFNRLGSILGLSQVQNPSFSGGGGPQMPNIDMGQLAQNQYQGQLNQFNVNQQNRQAMMGGLFDMGSAAVMASDRRLKTDVSFLGFLRDLPVYAYRYIWGGPLRVGVMAQDMLRIRPEAVVTVGDWLAVDYGKL